jgi:hypothetical protein
MNRREKRPEMMKSQAGTNKTKKPEHPKDKYYYMHQHKKPIVISGEELQTMGGGEIKTLGELIEKDNERRAKQRIANSKSNKKRYASFKELQAIKAENDKLKNIMSADEARAEAEKRAEMEERGAGFDLLIDDSELQPLNELICYITGTNTEDENFDFFNNFLKKNRLKRISYYEDESDQRRQLNKIINKLNLCL